MESAEHQDLVNIIKGVHEKLRKAVYFSQDSDKVWAEHLKEHDLREKYSVAMFKLATEVWKGKDTRITWTFKTSMDYFYNGGLEHSLLRQMKLNKVFHQKQCTNSLSFDRFKDDDIQHSYQNLNRKLELLDVGSCYNPFSKFKEFECTAIDLTPATKDVLPCDFLSVKVKPRVEESLPNNNSNEFIEESFDIVVLSLVLEYLPTSSQRVIFCHKSWQVLRENGLCVIITPDSKSLHHNADMMKSWKLAMQKIGFIRVKYEKLEHIHCMAFRKLKKDNNILDLNSLSELLYIPQDFKSYSTKETVQRTDEEDLDISNNFLELPNEDI